MLPRAPRVCRRRVITGCSERWTIGVHRAMVHFMLHLALTGNIASGKSTVAAMLAARGATIIDADLLARDAVAVGTPGLDAIIERFGTRMLRPDGSLDRAALRITVFHDPIAREALNAIVHPAVGRLREEALYTAAARGDRMVISDIPLLFELGLEHGFDGVILVDAPVALRLERMMRDRGLPLDDAQAMINAQWPIERKRAGSDWIIENDGSRAELEARVDALWAQLQTLPPRPPDPPLPQQASRTDTTC